MRLPEKSRCFACGSGDHRVFCSFEGLGLITCGVCRSEWLTGNYPGEVSYTYEEYESDLISQQYHASRARRFLGYLRQLGAVPGPNLLDVGCGTGEFLAAAKDTGFNPTGLELSRELARKTSHRTGLPVLSGDLIQDLVFPPDSFEVITLWGVLEHVADPTSLLQACTRLLRPGGLLVLETPNALGLFKLVAGCLMQVTRGRIYRPFRETLGAGHVTWFSPAGLRRVAPRLGLQLLDLRASRNSTRFLLRRFSPLPLPKAILFQAATLLLNHVAAPLGRPNQLQAALRK